MLGHERRRRILGSLNDQKQCSVDALQRELGVSRSTLQRDLRELEGQGRVVRVHGGVIHPQYLRGESTLRRRAGERPEAKRRIAEAAAELVPANAAVFIDAGTTGLALSMRLLVREDLKLFTHSVPLLQAALENGTGASVTALGGELRVVSGALVGVNTQKWLEHLHFDMAFVGASGLCPRQGASTTELHESDVKSAMLERAAQRVLLCDVQKCGRPAAVVFAPWKMFDRWIVDRKAPRRFASVACHVQVAP